MTDIQVNKNNRSRKRKRTFGSNNPGNESRNAISIKNFIKKGQNDAAFHRQRKKKEFIRKAKIVNSYKRLLKKEGRESTGSDTTKAYQKGKATTKTDRFFKEKQKARLREEKQKDRESKLLEMEKKKVKNKKRRKVMSKKLAKRTRKGQPIMKNLLGNLLEQIEKQD